MGAVAMTLEDLQERIGQQEHIMGSSDHARARHVYRQTLETLRDHEGYEIDVEDELDELPYDIHEAVEHIHAREGMIRRSYRRTPNFETRRPGAVRSEADLMRVCGYATANRCSCDEACRALGLAA